MSSGPLSLNFLIIVGPILLPLLIPLVIIVTRKRGNGALIACSVIALLCYGFLWLSLFGSTSTLFPMLLTGTLSPLRYALYIIGNFLMLAAWVLALHDAAQARRGRWLAALVITGFLSVSGTTLLFDPCELIGLIAGPNAACGPVSPALSQLMAAIPLAGPIAALVYALRARGPRPRGATPDGLSVSPLSTPMDDGDGELELRTERL